MGFQDANRAGTPTLNRLDAEDVATIHEASLRLLEESGIRFDHPRARRLFENHGASVSGENIVRIPPGIVEEAIEDAPDSFQLHGRNADNTVGIGESNRPIRAPGYGSPYVQFGAGSRRRARLSDYEDLVQLAHESDAITCTGYSICEPTDVDESTRHYEMLGRLLKGTDKPILGPVSGSHRAQTCMDMVGIAVGDPGLTKPYVAGLFNTAPPRSMGREMLEGLFTYAEHGQPLIVSSFVTAGTSGPPAVAPLVVQANAENLAAIALTQLVNRGTPVVYGLPGSTVDTTHGSLAIGNPEASVFASVAAQMGRYYELPSRGGGGLTDAKQLDYQSGFESAFTQLVTGLSGVDFVLHGAGILASYSTISPEKFLLDCESIRYLDRFDRSIVVEDAHLSPEQLTAADSAGHFLAEETPAGARPLFEPELVDKRSYREWDQSGRESLDESVSGRVAEILAKSEPPRMAADTRRDLDRYVERHK